MFHEILHRSASVKNEDRRRPRSGAPGGRAFGGHDLGQQHVPSEAHVGTSGWTFGTPGTHGKLVAVQHGGPAKSVSPPKRLVEIPQAPCSCLVPAPEPPHAFL